MENAGLCEVRRTQAHEDTMNHNEAQLLNLVYQQSRKHEARIAELERQIAELKGSSTNDK
jgi:hypothetical protein